MESRCQIAASRGVRLLIGVSVATLMLANVRTARAELRWNPAYAADSVGDYLFAGLGVVATAGGGIAKPLSKHWRGGVLFDEDARDALRLGSEEARRNARDVSDVLLTLLVSYPFAIDAVVAAGWHHERPDVARSIGIINLQTLGALGGVQGGVKLLTSRERPYGRECGGELLPTDRACTRGNRFESFFSGHSAMSFASAALICTHQANLNLYDDPTAGTAVCASGFVLAGATAVLRIVGDQHYASDVIVGAAVGTLFGFGIPWLLHYRHGDDVADEPPEETPSVNVVPAGLGLGVVGSF